MERRVEREFEILTAIAEESSTTQRVLAARLGVALGLTNLYLKRLVKKGYIKVAGFPHRPAARKRLRYLLTARGLTEKSRLTYDYTSASINIYRRTREILRETLGHLPGNGAKRVVLYGTGEAAELAYITLKELNLEPIGIFAREGGGDFLGFTVRGLSEILNEQVDGIIIATFDQPERYLAELRDLGIPQHKLLTLRRPHPDLDGG